MIAEVESSNAPDSRKKVVYMNIGDIVCCDYHPGTVGVLLSEPRASTPQDNVSLFGVLDCEIYKVVDVYMPWGNEIHLIEDMEVIK